MPKLPRNLSILLAIIFLGSYANIACQAVPPQENEPDPAAVANIAPPSEPLPQALSVALVNNYNMNLLMQNKSHFEKQYDIAVSIDLIAENDLREKLTTHASTGGGQYDVVQVGNFETPFWAQNGWLTPLDPMFNAMSDQERFWYDRTDIIPSIESSLQDHNGYQYALPVYGETALLFYNKTILAEHGQVLAEQPTWDEVLSVARACRDEDTIGIALRCQPGWGMNGAVVASMIHSYDAYWFDSNWHSGFDTVAMRQALKMYKDLMRIGGMTSLDDVTAYGYNECLELMAEGKAALFYDATSLAGYLESAASPVRGEIGYCQAPTAKQPAPWIWAWGLGIDSASDQKVDAFKFITWVSSKDYTALVADNAGWQGVPSGVRLSTYNNPHYQFSAPFAGIVLNAIEKQNPTVSLSIPIPYRGSQFCGIPEFTDFGDKVMQFVADYVTDQITLEECIEKCHSVVNQAAIDGGYQK